MALLRRSRKLIVLLALGGAVCVAAGADEANPSSAVHKARTPDAGQREIAGVLLPKRTKLIIEYKRVAVA